MDPHRGENRAVALRQLHRRARGRKIKARNQQPLDSHRRGASQHLVAVVVEGRILEMTVRVDQPRQAGRDG
jgi:hypothetical protein